jgi:lysophospholipase L1-like esterase
MIEILHEKDIQALLLTLPTVVKPGMTYEELKDQKVFFPYYAGAYSVDKFLSLHRSYNNVIRRTSSKHGVPLVDLDMIFNKHDKDDLFWDTMHPSEKGQLLIAKSLLKKVQEVLQKPTL